MSDSSGLVEQVTTVRTGSLVVSTALKELNKQRRIRRMRRVVIRASEAARDAVDVPGFRWWCLFVTLTYRDAEGWDACHIRSYIKALRRYLEREGHACRYQWVVELTQSGRPHYHVLVWLPHGVRVPKPDASGQWPHGLSKIEVARNAVGYLVKYATKGGIDLYSLPKGARLFGVGGGNQSEKLAAHRAGLPMWLLEHLPDFARASKVARVGWVCRSTGAVHRSPFKLEWGRSEWGEVIVTITKRTDA